LEVHLEETIHEDEMKIYVFSSDKWIFVKDLNVFVTFNMVRLSDQLVNNNSLMVRWVINSKKSVVDISSVMPMSSSENHNQRRSKKSAKAKDKQTFSITLSHMQKSVDNLLRT
jgi:hypothetical protein